MVSVKKGYFIIIHAFSAILRGVFVFFLVSVRAGIPGSRSESLQGERPQTPSKCARFASSLVRIWRSYDAGPPLVASVTASMLTAGRCDVIA